MKLREDMEEVNKRVSKIMQRKKYEIVVIFGEALDKYGRQLQDPNRIVTIHELRILWEMMRVELGEPVGSYPGSPNYIYENEQTESTFKDSELGKIIEETAVAFYHSRRVKSV